MSTLAVHPWPSAAVPAWDGALLALAVAHPAGGLAGHGEQRNGARLAVRAALCEVASLLLDIGEERLEVASTPGSAPRLLVDGSDAGIGISISHAAGLSVAVLHRAGAVGVDLMQIGLASDWARVAHDYLGMAVATCLAAISDGERPLAFCQAWTRREAAFKLRGEQLREWQPGDLDPSRTAFFSLQLADGLVGTAAIGR